MNEQPAAGERLMTIAEALREGLREEMRRDSSVFVMGEDVGIPGGFGGPFTVTLGLSDEFGHQRILDTPISEAGIVGAAVGAALVGMRPVAEVQYGDFLFLVMDQLINQAAKIRFMSGGKLTVPLVLRAPVGATTRGAQHGQTPEAHFMQVPGLKVVCPSNAYDAKGLLKAAIRDNNPVLMFEHKLLYGSKGARKEPGGMKAETLVPGGDYTVPIGKAKVVREGSDVTLVATLLMVYRSLAAAEALARQGIEAEVIDLRTLLPLDHETILTSVRKTSRLVTVEEGNKTGGWGAEVVAVAAEKAIGFLDAPVLRIAAPDTPVPFAPIMENFYVPSAERIAREVGQLVRP